jgi:hypothetical protein
MPISIIDALNDQQNQIAFRRGEILGAEFLRSEVVSGRLKRGEHEIARDLDEALEPALARLSPEDIVALSQLLLEATEVLRRDRTKAGARRPRNRRNWRRAASNPPGAHGGGRHRSYGRRSSRCC